ncbi:SprA-related family protein [Hydrogenovibrio sp. SC-1]|uniref:putative metalloprotease CJM1_0395 family protein n=1 Tax=Hydrogenovibrio sp. SC-1 TaxID=2065820 RepID=UPI000C7A3F21|nr:putative metalloprotease CJM1_0395 family protein [Hydrogenovibrio sp. SC-1]PLA74479.1 SprA-related family protein [Hydrogenovibrio sp. SC-1]
MINSISVSSTYGYGSQLSTLAQKSNELSTSQSRYIDVPASVGGNRIAPVNTTGKSENADRVDGQSNSTQPSSSTTDPQRDFETVIRQLKARDIEVKIHEQAHLAAGGQYVSGGASYVYQVGPDGRRYAVGGEVSIDTSPVSGDPEATLVKAQQVQAAALAPSEPSSQDYKVAQAAASMAAQARSELSSTKMAGNQSSDEKTSQSTESGQQQSNPNSVNQITSNNSDINLLNADRTQFEVRMLAG